MFARPLIMILLLTQLVLQSIMPCCVCASSSEAVAEMGWSAFPSPCECTHCPTSSEPTSVPADHDSKHWSCPFCSGAVVDTSQVASPDRCLFDVLSSRFDGLSDSTRSLPSVFACHRRLPSLHIKDLGVRLLI